MRRFFRFLNKFFMVPMFRFGFGPFFGNPISGYIMVLQIVGRKTGKLRYAPVNYAIHEGKVYCMAGFGRLSDWYRNLQANTSIEVILPGGAISGTAQEVHDPAKRTLIIRQILKNAGLVAFLDGFNPYRIEDEELAKRTAGMPLVSIQPNGVGNGASDPAGWAWVWTLIFIILVILVIWFILR
jgi:deazaflavin-dependent oxidoreductase (nitroreductase family)